MLWEIPHSRSSEYPYPQGKSINWGEKTAQHNEIPYNCQIPSSFEQQIEEVFKEKE